MTIESYVSERDFVANYLLPSFREAAKELGLSEVVGLHVDAPVDGIADLTVDRAGKRLLVVEAKFKKKAGKIEYDIEPRDPSIIDQALMYAAKGGYPYYATCNSKRFTLFQFLPGVKAYESEILSYEYERNPQWAIDVLKTILGIVPPRLKPIDDTLVDTLHEAFRDLYPRILYSLNEKLQDKKFRDRYMEWLASQGIELNDESNRLTAQQATYLLLNKILFYMVVQSIYPDRLKPLRIEPDEDVRDSLQDYFTAIRKIDYAPIYESDIISEIPLSLGATERLRTLIDTLIQFDFSKIKSEFLGRVYEKLIPPLERKRLGQFYTPPSIVNLIIQLTLTDPNAAVLDPACGSGTFLVAAYHRLRELKGIPPNLEGAMVERFHQQLLSQIYGVDINQFPAHLSVIGLAIQNPWARVKKVGIVVKDFFDIRGGQTTLSGFESLTTEGKETLVELPPYFDVVVANPPYIEQEFLGVKEKKKIKELIEGEYKAVFIGAPSKKVKKGIILDKQSDIYVYFFLHGLALLKDGGKLGFITSNKWLEVGYGESFQRFLLDHCKILYVVEFDRAIFPDAEVNTAITILEKEKEDRARVENAVKFVRLKQKLGVEETIRILEMAEESYEDEKVRVNVVRQGSLKPGKWNVYFRAPPVYQKIVSHTRMKPLGELAKVFRGPTTGCDEFFELTKEEVQRWKIESRFLQPYISSSKGIRELVTEREKQEEYLFMVDAPKDSLKGTNALKYIEHGERLEVEPKKGSERGTRRVPELETPKGRRLWYALPKYPVAPILVVKMMDVRLRAIWNRANFHASNRFYYVIPKNKEDEVVLLGFLNSSVAAFLTELYGRSYGGGVLELAAYELKRLPVIDAKALHPEDRDRIARAFKELVNAVDIRVKIEEEMKRADSRQVGDRLKQAIAEERDAYHRLDEVIYDVLGLSKVERIQVETGLAELQEIRRLRTTT
jgi:type I restriction-modification system DNA methylase subunit